MYRLSICTASILLAACAGSLHAQKTSAPRIDLAVTYTAERTLKANSTQGAWMQGGSVQLGAEIWRGWGVGADVTGVHIGSVGSSGVPFSEVAVAFGPRYRWHSGHRVSVYGQTLVGEGDAFDSVLPGRNAAQSSSNTLALKLGGGLDYSLSRRLSVRVVDAAWMRTQFGNSTDNLQNDFRVGSGLVLKFGR